MHSEELDQLTDTTATMVEILLSKLARTRCFEDQTPTRMEQ